jgi:hypothetical protein
MPSRKEFDDLMKSKESKEDPKLDTVLESAALQMEHLTGDPDWDRFLTKIQPRIERLQNQIDDLREKVFKAPTPDVFQAIRSEYWYTKGLLDAYKDVLSIPKTIVEASKILN